MLTVIKIICPVCYRKPTKQIKNVAERGANVKRPSVACNEKRLKLIDSARLILNKLEHIEPFSREWGRLVGMQLESEPSLEEFIRCNE